MKKLKTAHFFLMIALFLLVCVRFCLADSDTYTVEGEIMFEGKGNIFVSLV